MKAFLFIVVSFVIAATAAMIIIGAGTFEGTVVKDPYGTGLRWDEIQRQRRESGWSVALLSHYARTGKNDVVLSVRERNGRPLDGAVVELQLNGPDSAGADSEARAQENDDGNFHALVDIPARGSWTVMMTVTHGGRTIEFEDTLFVE